MATCEVCGKKFHACGSCCLANDWEYHFCCEEHYHQSDLYQTWHKKAESLVDILSIGNRDLLLSILEDNDDADSVRILMGVLEART